MKKILRTAIVGAGKVSHNHAEALNSTPYASLVAVCGRSKDKTRNFADKYGIRPYTDINAMLAKEDLQAVVICTPHPAHAQPAVAALNAGVNVLVEKPLASTIVDCDAMIDAAKINGMKLGVVSQRRFYEPVRRVKDAIDAGKIGKPVLGVVQMYSWRDQAYYESDPWRGTWKYEGGGVLVNQAPHLFDLFQWLMGPIAEIFGFWANLNHPYIEVEDTAVAVVRFKSGALGNILVSNSQKPGIYGKVHIHGENGASIGVQTEGGAMFIAGVSEMADPPFNDLWTIPEEKNLLPEWQHKDRANFDAMSSTQHYFNLQDQDFLLSILEDRDPLITGEEGRVTVEIFTAIYQSTKSGLPIKLPLLRK
jgi:UDP-N-acetyl-2-amino-2-deoxyglucuronate dehydrogenase